MAFTFINSTFSVVGSSPQSAVWGITSGNLLIVMCFSSNNGSISISDTSNHVWTPISTVSHGGTFEQIFTSTAKATTSITITITASGAFVEMLLGQYAPVGTFDTQSFLTQQVSNLTTYTSASITPVGVGELGIFLFSAGGGTTCSLSTITSGWNIRQNFPGGAGTQILAYADNLNLPTGSQTVSGTLSTAQKSDIIVAAFSLPPIILGGDSIGSDRSIQHLTTETNHLLQV